MDLIRTCPALWEQRIDSQSRSYWGFSSSMCKSAMENVAEASPPPGGPAPNPADPPSPTSPAEPAGDAAAPVEADEDNKTVFSEQTCLEEESLGDVTEGSTDLEAAGLDLDKLNAGSSSAAAAGSGAVAAGPGVTSSGSTVAAGLSAPASDAAGSSPMTSRPGSAVAEAARGSAEGPPANVALGATATTADPGPTTAASMALDGYDSKRDYQRKVRNKYRKRGGRQKRSGGWDWCPRNWHRGGPGGPDGPSGSGGPGPSAGSSSSTIVA